MGFFQRLMGEEPSLLQQWLHYNDKGSFAEYLIKYALGSISGYQKVLCNIYVPYKDKTSEIDVLLIHEKGIFVFESKNYSGWIFGGLEKTQWTQCLPNKQKSRFYNPIMQNKTHIKALSQFLNVDETMFISYVIFSQRCELKDVPKSSEKCVVLKRTDMLKQLKKDIKERDIVYSTQEIDKIYNELLPLTKVTEEQKKKHIENINNKNITQTKEHINSVAIEEKNSIKDFSTNSIASKLEGVINKPINTIAIEQTKLYKELKQYRIEKSKEEGIKPYFLYSNIQLEEIVNKKPSTVVELKAIKGFGDVKCEKYGKDIIGIVRENT
jgi:superfamily II DNA helicase RecQ